MHILFLTDNFPPETNAPASRTFEHTREWVKLGHQVTVMTCAPNYPEGVLYEGYQNKWCQREWMEGIEVVRVKTFMAPNRGRVRRVLDYISFALMSGIVALFRKRADIIVATSPQFFCTITACVLSLLHRRPWVFELRDIWPASISAVNAIDKTAVIRLLEKLELFLYRRANRIVAVTTRFREDLIERGIDGARIEVVTNGVDLSLFAPQHEKDSTLCAEYRLKGKFVAGYIGTHGMAQTLKALVNAAELLRERDDIRFLLIGAGAELEDIAETVREKQLDNVVMVPRQPKHLMPAHWGLCDVSIVPLRDRQEFTKVIPSKIFESMGMGLPILIALPRGEATAIIEDTGAGTAIPPEDPVAMAQAIAELSTDGERLATMAAASAAAASEFDRKRLAGNMLEALLRTAAR